MERAWYGAAHPRMPHTREQYRQAQRMRVRPITPYGEKAARRKHAMKGHENPWSRGS